MKDVYGTLEALGGFLVTVMYYIHLLSDDGRGGGIEGRQYHGESGCC